MGERKPMRRTPLKRRTALQSSSIRQFRIKRDKKRTGWVKGRYVATREEWQDLLRWKLGPCRVCGETRMPSLHHVVGRDARGDDLAENLIPLCGSGTTGCHGIYTSHNRGTSMDGIVRTWEEVADAIRRSFREDELSYIARKVGEYYLDRHYPLLEFL